MISPLTNKDRVCKVHNLRCKRGNPICNFFYHEDSVLEAKQGMFNEIEKFVWGHDYSEMQKEHTLSIINKWFQIEKGE